MYETKKAEMLGRFFSTMKCPEDALLGTALLQAVVMQKEPNIEIAIENIGHIANIVDSDPNSISIYIERKDFYVS